ncbi:hypothetical protein BKA67DRAFT_655152 [Truncatella angustata]|uniref:Uncharacterized protein n=1 Tax=Truncatella angustata TaxID=152316 RepID=A0A9P8UR63_9PEZI|nr:uncharacterized protein BKA67DRAFT_655152 [Truncatella angustata]KAH6656848.1 hypothetical protein BKA67DRAFT_655152 [Truncatella angustata]KAH8193886.1 hypothetical protein TruAng_011952 [Truncatella angustata]
MRRRQNSSLSSSSRGPPHHTRRTSKLSQEPIEPKSPHVSDKFLQSFLSPSFDAADYLNSSLPPLQAHVSSITPSQEGAVPLSDLSSQAQTLLSQLNAQTTRLTNTLTQLTDDILRSGSRLAYEVELLRGETLSLSESLSDGLHDDVVKFVPSGLQEHADVKPNGAAEGTQRRTSAPVVPDGATDTVAGQDVVEDPAYITHLRTLTLVRARLDSVIKTFGDAMEFVFPPSELSVSSGFLSVSAPDAGGHDHSTEEKGQQVLRQLRDEISDLLKSKDPVAGVEKATLRVEELKELNEIWKGTAEEKGRAKFIDSLAKLVEDRHKELLREMEQNGKRDTRVEVESSPRKSTEGPTDTRGATGYGFMSQLQKLRSGL